jgi:hypothetical protein
MNTPYPTLDDLAHLLDEYDLLHLECDGLTRILDYVLHQHSIRHKVCAGRISYPATGESMAPHFWIEVPLEEVVAVVDYRARMWLGDEADILHGIFRAGGSAVVYDGSSVVGWRTANKPLYELLIAASQVSFAELLSRKDYA